jgi:hypothetical protein
LLKRFGGRAHSPGAAPAVTPAILPVIGRLHVVIKDGSEQEFGRGDVAHIPPGHDAWVVGNEPVVIVDISGMRDYAKH